MTEEMKTRRREEYDNGMRYIDGELWRFIEDFKDLGDFQDRTEAQRKLVQRLRNLPMKYLLSDEIIVLNEKEEEEERCRQKKEENRGLTF